MTTPRYAPARRDHAARNEIVVANLPLARWKVVKMSHSAYVAACPRELLDDAALDGLIRAAELWDDTRGIRFSTYATWAVHSHVMKTVRRFHRTRTWVLADVPGLSLRRDSEMREWEPAAPEPPEPDPRADVVARALMRLNARDRLVLQMRHMDGAGLDAIASAVGGVTRERARQLCLRAAARLRLEVERLQEGVA